MSWRNPQPAPIGEGRRILDVKPLDEIDLEYLLISQERMRRAIQRNKAESRRKRGPVEHRFEKSEFERAARMYKTNTAAGEALGMSGAAFKKACDALEIEAPGDRTKRERKERKKI